MSAGVVRRGIVFWFNGDIGFSLQVLASKVKRFCFRFLFQQIETVYENTRPKIASTHRSA
jgi:hypothetical protein